MSTKTKLAAVMLLLNSARGTYIPRDFLCDNTGAIDHVHCGKWNLSHDKADWWQDAANPDSEYYWEAWEWILNNAEFTTEDGDKFRLHQDGDLWALCFERMTDEEKVNFDFDLDEGDE